MGCADGFMGPKDHPDMAPRYQMTRGIRTRSIGVVVTLSVWLLAFAASTPAQAALPQVRPHARVEVGTDAWRLYRATNASRGRFGMPRLQLDREMSVAVRRHTLAMARAGELFHTSDVGVYLGGIEWRVWGENIGFTPGDVESMQQAFMDSPPHRGNILNAAFRNVAIGAVRVDGTLWVTVFLYG